MGDQSKHRLTDAELEDAFGYAGDSLRLTAALSELRDVRPVVAAAWAFYERWQTADFEDDTKPARQALFAALTKLRAKEHGDG